MKFFFSSNFYCFYLSVFSDLVSLNFALFFLSVYFPFTVNKMSLNFLVNTTLDSSHMWFSTIWSESQTSQLVSKGLSWSKKALTGLEIHLSVSAESISMSRKYQHFQNVESLRSLSQFCPVSTGLGKYLLVSSKSINMSKTSQHF